MLERSNWPWVKTNGTILGLVNSPPSLEPILVGIGMFTGGTIWILTHVGRRPGRSKSHCPEGMHRMDFDLAKRIEKSG